MKIALIGNMNNNNFALMRYFRDLGQDAHLFLYSSDGTGNLSHFRPQDDTVDYKKWQDYIHLLGFEESYRSLFIDPIRFSYPVSKKKVKKIFEDYDILIGSGLTPAILDRCGIALDVFFPYAIGVEYIGFKPKGNWAKNLLYKAIEKRQKAAINKAKLIFNAELGYTKEILQRLGLTFINLAIPMYYNREVNSSTDTKTTNLIDQITKFDLKFFSHSRQMWIRNSTIFSEEEWKIHNKNSDWLIQGFSEFLKKTKKKAVLVLLEYGPDVVGSKELINKLGISQNVVWLPKMARKDLMQILKICDVGVGEFMQGEGVIWGGTGWEILASGKPLMQSINFSPKSFREIFGHDLPSVLDVKSPIDVSNHLAQIELSNGYTNGMSSIDWFNTYNGISLAKEWVDVIKSKGCLEK